MLVMNHDEYRRVPTPLYWIMFDKTLWHILLFVTMSCNVVHPKQSSQVTLHDIW